MASYQPSSGTLRDTCCGSCQCAQMWRRWKLKQLSSIWSNASAKGAPGGRGRLPLLSASKLGVGQQNRSADAAFPLDAALHPPLLRSGKHRCPGTGIHTLWRCKGRGHQTLSSTCHRQRPGCDGSEPQGCRQAELRLPRGTPRCWYA